ncbi:MAG: hypothetical protein LBU20_01945 [Candidatus Nomurabacteria bacterium]|jgi:tetratricopeptide (TPR) repeat protein|nr:hypothetical protein [Candidatus Nomurabacteria bacterium]
MLKSLENKRIDKRVADIINLMDSDKYKEALVKLNNYERVYSANRAFKLAKVGLYIDLGNYLNDKEAVEKGISTGETCLSNQDFKDYHDSLIYNVSNGIHFRISRHFKDHGTYFGVERDVHRCIRMLKKSISISPSPNAMVNLANLYDEVGRTLEAIIEYDRAAKTDTQFGMVYGNEAIAVQRLAYVSEYKNAYLIRAHQLFSKAIQYENSVIRSGGSQALNEFKRKMGEIEEAFKNQKHLLNINLTHPRFDQDKMGKDELSYTHFCLENDLYLTLHIFDRHSTGSVGDNISTSFITKVTDTSEQQRIKETFMRLNEINESYITGRYILWLSQKTSEDLSNISKQSLLVNNLDYTAHNIYTGLLKSAYTEGFSTLDKIAGTINYYLNLNQDERKINYRNIWYANLNKKDGFNNIIKSQTYHIFGLYSIMRELGEEFSEIRNSIEHRYFKIGTLPDPESKTPTFEEFTQRTTEVFYRIKCAIVCLLSFINTCEEFKSRDSTKSGRMIPVMLANTDQWLDLWH